MNTAQFISIFNSGGNPLGPFQERVEADGGTVEGLDNMLAKYDASASWQLIPSAVKAGTAYAQRPNTSVGDLTVTRASSGTFTNSAGVVQTAASNVLRTDYRNANGTLSATGRYLLEPQRTNSIRNSSMVGAVAGSPGTIPTNWNTSTVGLTQTIVGIGNEDGLPYIDFRFNGTASGTDLTIGFEGSNVIVASNGQAWANSCYLKVIAQPNPPLSFALNTIERTSTGAFVASGSSAALSLTSSLNRFSFVRTLSGGATVERVQPRILVTLTIGQTYDFTIRIAAPQMELGAYATTWVPTTTAAVTRLADTASKTSVSSLIGQTEGTLFTEFNFGGAIDGRDIFNINSGTNANFASIFLNGGLLYARLRANTGALIDVTKSAFTTGTHKVALAYANNDLTMYLDGVLVGNNTSASVAFSLPLSVIRVAETVSGGSSSQLGGGVAQAALFPTRLPNAQLAKLTTL